MADLLLLEAGQAALRPVAVASRWAWRATLVVVPWRQWSHVEQVRADRRAAVASALVPLVVQKFGGTSVADPERIREVADHVARTKRRGDDVVVVVSAMGKETDELLRLAADVSKVRPGREMDMLITAGERKATALLCMALHDLGVPADSFTGSQAGFITDGAHTNAKIVELRPERILRGARRRDAPPWSGAPRACPASADVTFLGRGGSDTTAVALAHALDAHSCELYTDVSGVFTADPRLVPHRATDGGR